MGPACKVSAPRSRKLKKRKEDPSGLFDKWAKEVKKYFATLQQDHESVEHKIMQTQKELADAEEEYNAIFSMEEREEAEEVDTIGDGASNSLLENVRRGRIQCQNTSAG